MGAGDFELITIVEPNEKLDALERELKEMITHHQQAYQRAIEPIVSQLAAIDNYRKRRYILVPVGKQL